MNELDMMRVVLGSMAEAKVAREQQFAQFAAQKEQEIEALKARIAELEATHAQVKASANGAAHPS